MWIARPVLREGSPAPQIVFKPWIFESKSNSNCKPEPNQDFDLWLRELQMVSIEVVRGWVHTWKNRWSYLFGQFSCMVCVVRKAGLDTSTCFVKYKENVTFFD
jgi:hypothetical protein